MQIVRERVKIRRVYFIVKNDHRLRNLYNDWDFCRVVSMCVKIERNSCIVYKREFQKENRILPV